MEIGRYLVEAHLREGRSVGELAALHGIHRSWLYRLLARYRAEGEAGLGARSRRAHFQPRAIADSVVEQIVALRSELTKDGLDAGALTIHWHLLDRTGSAPSVSSIWRILRRRGLVTPQPRKRPQSAMTRFAAELPNECW